MLLEESRARTHLLVTLRRVQRLKGLSSSTHSLSEYQLLRERHERRSLMGSLSSPTRDCGLLTFPCFQIESSQAETRNPARLSIRPCCTYACLPKLSKAISQHLAPLKMEPSGQHSRAWSRPHTFLNRRASLRSPKQRVRDSVSKGSKVVGSFRGVPFKQPLRRGIARSPSVAQGRLAGEALILVRNELQD